MGNKKQDINQVKSALKDEKLNLPKAFIWKESSSKPEYMSTATASLYLIEVYV